jgi:hypothetical protein
VTNYRDAVSDPSRSRLPALWWAGPTSVALVGGLAFAFGFAPRLAEHVALPAAITVAPVTVVDHAHASHPSHHPTSTSTPTPARTPPATYNGGRTGGGTVVEPSRPVVTAHHHEDDTSGQWSGSATPFPTRTGTESGDR